MRVNQNAEDVSVLIDDIVAFTHDPLGYVLYNYPWGEEGTLLENEEGPREWQADILEEIGQKLRAGSATLGEVIQIAIASGHGIGKSAALAWVINWAMDTFEDCRGVVTAGTGSQLSTKLWPEVIKWRNMGLTKDWHKVTATRMASTAKGHEDNWRVDCETWNEHNTEAFQGLHNKRKRLICIYDEASGIADTVWGVTQGALTDEDTEIIWLVFGNPTRVNGKFHACFNSERHRWITRQIDARTVPGTNKKLLQQYIDDYGEDSDFVRVKVKGEFPRTGVDQFITNDDVKRCMRLLPNYDINAPLIMAVDIARKGSAQSVAAFRRGRDAKSLKWSKRRGLTNPQLVDWIAGLIEQHKPDAVVIDGDGIGMMTIDDLRNLGYQIHDFHGGQLVAGREFYNKRAEAWGMVKKDCIATAIALPDDLELETDLTGIQYGFAAKDGSIQLEKKDDMASRGMDSPDCGDALAMTYGVRVPRKDEQFARKRNVRAQGALAENDYYGEN